MKQRGLTTSYFTPAAPPREWSDRNYEGYSDCASLPVIVLTIRAGQAIITAANDHALETSGLSRSDLIGWNATSFLPFRETKRFWAAVRRCSGGNSCQVRSWLNLPSGRQRWAMTLNAVPSDDRLVEQIVLHGERLASDVAERSAMDSSSYRRLGLETPDLSFVFDPVSFRISKIGADGKPRSTPFSIEHLHEADRMKIPARIARVTGLPEGRAMTWMARANLPDGRGERAYVIRAYVVRRNADGTPALLGGSALDVTRHVSLEEQSRALRDELHGLRDEERRRFARELHDSTAQHLAALGLSASRLRQACAGNCDMKPIIDDMKVVIGEAQREIRVLAFLLHPPDLEEQGLEGAVRNFVTGYSRRSEVAVKLDIAPLTARLPADQARAVFRIIQEGLVNVQRHAFADTARVIVEIVRDRIIVTIADDGKGFTAPLGEQAGVGLAGMAARARAFGGDLTISSSDAGSELRVTMCIAS